MNEPETPPKHSDGSVLIFFVLLIVIAVASRITIKIRTPPFRYERSARPCAAAPMRVVEIRSCHGRQTYLQRRMLLRRSSLPMRRATSDAGPLLLPDVPDDFGRRRQSLHGG